MTKLALNTLLSICLVLAGCSTTQTISVADHADGTFPGIVVGDKVTLHLRSRREALRLKVEFIDETTLTGQRLTGPQQGSSIQIALTDVLSIETQSVQSARATRVAYVIAAGAAAILIALLLDELCESTSSTCDL